MKILITIWHPGQFHYFKFIAQKLQNNGHSILLFVRDKECIVDLVKTSGFNYELYGKAGDNMLSKFTHIFSIESRLLSVSLKFKPDIFLTFGNFYAGHVAFLLRKPHISLTDTEHAKLARKLNNPFASIILTPYVWNADILKKQILFKSLMETFYLNNKYFDPDTNVFEKLNLTNQDKYCVIRFISWNAHHDVGLNGLTYQNKLDIVNKIKEKCNVYISSEGELPEELEIYRLRTHPSQFHSVINYATLCISEGSTTASESAILGTPTIYVNPLKVSNCDEEEKYDLLYQSTNVDTVINKALEILDTIDVKVLYRERQERFISKMIDANDLIVWLIENYPQSKNILLTNPEYQEHFKLN